MLRLLLLLLPWPALACDLVDGFLVFGPLPSVPEDAAPVVAGPGTEKPCGIGALDATEGIWVAQAEVALEGRAALQLAAQGGARVFWDGALVGVLDDHRPLGARQDAFPVRGQGRHTLRVELRPPRATRVHFGVRLVALAGEGPRAVPVGPPIELPSPLALAAAPPPPAPSTRTLLPTAAPPPMPGLDREYLYDFHEFHLIEGWHRRRFALRIRTLAGLEQSRHLPHEGPGERTVGDVVRGETLERLTAWWADGAFQPTLPTWDWRIEVITARATPVFATGVGLGPVEVHDDVPAHRRHVWRATAAVPGATHLRVGPAPDPARWRAAWLAQHEAHLRPGLDDRPGQIDEIMEEIRIRPTSELDRAMAATRRLRASGHRAWPLLVRRWSQGPLPEATPVAGDFSEAWVQLTEGPLLDPVGGRPPPDGEVLPMRWRAPILDLGPPRALPAAVLGGVCGADEHPRWVRCSPTPVGLQSIEIKTDFAHFIRETRPATGCTDGPPTGAGFEVVARLTGRRPTADALARARFCRAVAAAIAEAP